MNEEIIGLILGSLFLLLQIINRIQIKRETAKQTKEIKIETAKQTEEIKIETARQTEEIVKIVESLRPKRNDDTPRDSKIIK